MLACKRYWRCKRGGASAGGVEGRPLCKQIYTVILHVHFLVRKLILTFHRVSLSKVKSFFVSVYLIEKLFVVLSRREHGFL